MNGKSVMIFTDHINRFWGQHLTTIVQQRRKRPLLTGSACPGTYGSGDKLILYRYYYRRGQDPYSARRNYNTIMDLLIALCGDVFLLGIGYNHEY